MREIREIYQRWLDGDLSQEDALFAIGDALEEAPLEGGGGPTGEEQPPLRPAIGRKGA